MPDGIEYLVEDINRKLLLIAAFKLPKKADRLIDAIVADMIQLQSQIEAKTHRMAEKASGLPHRTVGWRQKDKNADSTPNTQTENAKAEGR